MSHESHCRRPQLSGGIEARAGPAGEFVSQRVLYLLILASFLQLFHVHHTAGLHLKGIILQRANTGEKKHLCNWQQIFLRKHNPPLKSTRICPLREGDPMTHHQSGLFLYLLSHQQGRSAE